MHRHNRPGDHPAAGHLQVPTHRELDLRCIIQEFLLHSVVKFLPTMVRERSHIVEKQAIVLGVELRRSVRRSRAPSLAIAVDELAKGGIFRGLLLRPGSNKCQQCAGERQRHIQQPAPSLGIFVDGSAYRCGHSVSPRSPGTKVCREDVPTLAAYAIVISSVLQGVLIHLVGAGCFLARYSPSPRHNSPVNRRSWPNLQCIPSVETLLSLWGKEIALQEETMAAQQTSPRSLKSITVPSSSRSDSLFFSRIWTGSQGKLPVPSARRRSRPRECCRRSPWQHCMSCKTTFLITRGFCRVSCKSWYHSGR